MGTNFNEIFSVKKPAIAMVHLRALPGTVNYDADAGLDGIIDAAAREIRVLQKAGFDGLLFCNESDMPFTRGVSPAVVASMTYCITSLLTELSVPFGTDVIMDNRAAIAVSAATGGRFVRGIFTGVYASDLGILDTNGAEEILFKKHIHANEVALFARISQGLAAPIADRSPKLKAYGAAWAALADAIVVTGGAPGDLVNIEEIEQAREGAPTLPMIASNGISVDNVQDILAAADAVIVGTKIKEDGVTLNPTNPELAQSFMAQVRQYRERAKG